MEEKEILIKCQFGFREGSSCFTNPLSYYSRAADIIQEPDDWAGCINLHLRNIRQTLEYLEEEMMRKIMTRVCSGSFDTT